MSIKWISRRELTKLFLLLFVLLFAFCISFACSYINYSLQTADKTVDQRTLYTSQSLQREIKNMMFTAFLVCDDQRITDWINASEPNGELDFHVVKAAQGYLRTNKELLDIVLEQRNTGFLYSAANYTYRDVSLLKDFDAAAVLAKAQQNHLTFQLIDYKGDKALALPFTSAGGRVIFLFDIPTMASRVSTALTENYVDGAATFVLDQSGFLIMGNCPEQYSESKSEEDQISLLTLLFNGGYLEHSYCVSAQGWTVHSVLYLDSFLNAYHPFVKITILIVTIQFAISLAILLLYVRFLREPIFHMTDMLRSRLPDGALATDSSCKGDNAILSELQNGIRYLLNHFSDYDRIVPVDSDLKTWVNALGDGSPVKLEVGKLFPRDVLFLGVARIISYEDHDYLETRRQRQQIGSRLLAELSDHYEIVHCVPAAADCFLLFLNDTSIENEDLSFLLGKAADEIAGNMNAAISFAISIVEDKEAESLEQLYAQLYSAASIGALFHNGPVCTLDWYRDFREQPLKDMISEELLNTLSDADARKRNRAIAAYGEMVMSMPEQQRKKHTADLVFEMISHYGKILTVNEYRMMKSLLVENYDTFRLCSCLEEIGSLIAGAQNHTIQKASKWHETVLEISDFINNNLADPQLSVDLIAKKEGYSANYIRSMFKTFTGVSIAESIRQRRVEMACRLLTTTDEPINKIIERCGFNNYSVFFAIFKNHVGVTPNEYRQTYMTQRDTDK